MHSDILSFDLKSTIFSWQRNICARHLHLLLQKDYSKSLVTARQTIVTSTWLKTQKTRISKIYSSCFSNDIAGYLELLISVLVMQCFMQKFHCSCNKWKCNDSLWYHVFAIMPIKIMFFSKFPLPAQNIDIDSISIFLVYRYIDIDIDWFWLSISISMKYDYRPNPELHSTAQTRKYGWIKANNV